MAGTSSPKSARRGWYWLLALPFVATLFPEVYASGGPALFGIPFFYWYQLVWIALSGVCVGIVYFATR